MSTGRKLIGWKREIKKGCAEKYSRQQVCGVLWWWGGQRWLLERGFGVGSGEVVTGVGVVFKELVQLPPHQLNQISQPWISSV